MRAPPRLLPPALPSAESTGVRPRLSLALRSAPFCDEELHDVVPAPARRLVQRRQAARVLRIDVAAGLDQQLQRLDRSLLRVLAQVEAARIGIDRAEAGAAMIGVMPRELASVRSAPVREQQRIAGASSALAARSSGVAPVVSMPSRPRSLPTLRNGGAQLELRVRIGAGGEQHLDDLQAGGLVERRPIGPAAARNRVEIDRGIERRAAPEVPLVRVRALLDQIAARYRSAR